jgi:hypothetical protein
MAWAAQDSKDEQVCIIVSTRRALPCTAISTRTQAYAVWDGVHLSIFLSICLSICLSVRLSVYLSVCLSVYPSVCLAVYLSLCLYANSTMGYVQGRTLLCMCPACTSMGILQDITAMLACLCAQASLYLAKVRPSHPTASFSSSELPQSDHSLPLCLLTTKAILIQSSTQDSMCPCPTCILLSPQPHRKPTRYDRALHGMLGVVTKLAN